MADIQRKTLVVDEGGTGDYRTLTDAVAACADTPNEPVRFYIKHGIYEERPFIELADYIIEGEYRNATVLTASVGCLLYTSLSPCWFTTTPSSPTRWAWRVRWPGSCSLPLLC